MEDFQGLNQNPDAPGWGPGLGPCTSPKADDRTARPPAPFHGADCLAGHEGRCVKGLGVTQRKVPDPRGTGSGPSTCDHFPSQEPWAFSNCRGTALPKCAPSEGNQNREGGRGRGEGALVPCPWPVPEAPRAPVPI